jgi:hypothetical protein
MPERTDALGQRRPRPDSKVRSCVTALPVVWMPVVIASPVVWMRVVAALPVAHVDVCVVAALPVAVCRGALLRRRGVLGRHRDVDVAVVWGAVLEPVAVPEEGAVGGEVAVGRWRLAFLPAEKSGNERARSGFLTEGAISEWWIVTNL